MYIALSLNSNLKESDWQIFSWLIFLFMPSPSFYGNTFFLWSFHIWYAVMGNTCDIFSASISFALLQSSATTVMFSWEFSVELPIRVLKIASLSRISNPGLDERYKFCFHNPGTSLGETVCWIRDSTAKKWHNLGIGVRKTMQISILVSLIHHRTICCFNLLTRTIRYFNTLTN